ncbi:MAG TPA: hypothetical protein VMG40_08435 [Bryobacteraceae bacterium]|nr:hypothetical protein [Bryobacteraceae bacterium]
MSRALQKLRRRAPPADLSSALRVLASRERQRLVRGAGIAFADRVRLFADNLMRPLALPFAGGLFSAVVLFSMWVIPTYPLRGSSTTDVPLMWTTQAAVKQLGPVASTGNVIVDVTVDDTGRMVDYRIVCGNVANNEALRRSIEGFLIFTVFQPATALGQPVEGKIRLSLQSSQIDVKG